jgi:hypothetical protein
MIVVRIEHPVADYEAWKGAFDADPADRRGSGVRRYRIFRGKDDPNAVMVDLEFDTESEAEAMLASLRAVWDRVQGTLISDPRGRIVDVVETAEYVGTDP